MGKRVAYIPGKLYEVPEPLALPDKVALVSEIAERLLELREINATFPGHLMAKLDKIWRTNPRAFWVCLEVLAGDRATEKSLAELAKEMGTDKQNVAQTRRRDLGELAKNFPEAADVLAQLFARVPGSRSPLPPPC